MQKRCSLFFIFLRNMASKDRVIAIDGQAYVGKSAIAKGLAKLLNKELETDFAYINTGHMFRALAKTALDREVSLDDEKALLAMPFDIWFEGGKTLVKLDRKAQVLNWTDELNAVHVVQAASKVAIHPGVRRKLADMQRGYAQRGFIIMEGRDIGTAVFPNALCRIYAAADEWVRAGRIYKMFSEEEKRRMPRTDALIRELLETKLKPLDKQDTERKVSPLISKEEALRLGYHVHNSLEEYSVEDDVRKIYDSYICGELKKIGIHS
jgi:cytidylate kinase